MQFFGGSDVSPSPPAPTAERDRGNLGVLLLPGPGCSFHSFRTNTYKLSFMESPSGIKKTLTNHQSVLLFFFFFLFLVFLFLVPLRIILVMHPRTGDLREALKYIYSLYVEYVAKNPLYDPGTPIRCDFFNTNLDQYVRRIS
ncbi:hypothetical protein EUGRSUZ_H04599 [Eucalyptus grandis]|uniref:Uncharacterized protein n=2 Tax=Eucalyptus grandis TaxID=71139 RepID=A0ACC3JXP4_EUCGR|nr:hypothetical protein EUGRSUZ_H04599 [Eucalyptus grandis]